MCYCMLWLLDRPLSTLDSAGVLPWSWLNQQAARQTAVGEPRVRFYSHAAVTVPVLLLGFVCLEGQTLVSDLATLPVTLIELLADEQPRCPLTGGQKVCKSA